MLCAGGYKAPDMLCAGGYKAPDMLCAGGIKLRTCCVPGVETPG